MAKKPINELEAKRFKGRLNPNKPFLTKDEQAGYDKVMVKSRQKEVPKSTMLSKALKQSSPPKSLVPIFKEGQNDFAEKRKKEADYIIKVLGEDIYIKRDITILRVSHDTKQIEGNQTFMLLDKKVQEFMVVLTRGLLKGDGNERYYKADKKAFDFIIAKYPKVKKSFWLFAFGVLLGSVYSELNTERTRRLSKVVELTIKKQKK